ncbi:MAG: nicotinamide mononucleotide transporter [Marinilabiliales bacterium]|nr:MAG: nicotinamide mononucleotide transporter [Marinilabiliales bacterium]
MEISSFLETLYSNILDTSILEIIAVIFGLLSVWYAKKANILVYPTGIISVLIYVNICFESQLYADMGINAFYFIMSVYGWIMWSRKNVSSKERKISWSSAKLNIFSFVFFVFSLFVTIGLLKIFKGDDASYWSSYVPYIDTFTTAISVVAMLQMALKKIENWILWIIVDLVSVPLYFYKGLIFTSLQYAVFLILAILGYFEWKRIIQQENAA